MDTYAPSPCRRRRKILQILSPTGTRALDESER